MTRTLMFSGLVITGLRGSPAVQASTASGAFALTGSLNIARYKHTGTLLSSGEVRVTGGLCVNGLYTSLASAGLYDPSTQVWTLTSSISENVSLPATSVLLTNADLLIANDAQFYSPGTATCVTTGPLPTLSGPPTNAVPLGNGNVLGTGYECKSSNNHSCHNAPMTIVYLYSISGNSWSRLNELSSFQSHGDSADQLRRIDCRWLLRFPAGYLTALRNAELYAP